MISLIYLLLILPCAFSQIPGLSGLLGLVEDEIQQDLLGGGIPGDGIPGGGIPGGPGGLGTFGPERSYYVRGRLLCGFMGAEGATVSLWDNGEATPVLYEESVVDVSGNFYVKAEILNGGVWNPVNPYGYISLRINHNCQGQRQMTVELPTSYFNQGIGAVKVFDIGTINLEGPDNFIGGGGLGGFGGGIGNGFGGDPVQF
ncbi:Transthyretin-like family protein [Ancylostoma ceylanicum]|uniref:Transthyretin-like family protein n=1 Tax=Ancylostoma ceylanicum TaxID=53326 RepID=A0A0D6LIR6_9BILA|nr:Transthyretin-like family protein [Ancylostoma ceylanicum]